MKGTEDKKNEISGITEENSLEIDSESKDDEQDKSCCSKKLFLNAVIYVFVAIVAFAILGIVISNVLSGRKGLSNQLSIDFSITSILLMGIYLFI